MISTLYGEIKDEQFAEFCQVAGHQLEKDGSFAILSEEVDYWQLTSPSATEEKRWSKRLGWLPIRDYNFEYALYKTARWKKSTKVLDGKEIMVRAFNIPAAIKFASEKFFESNGNPIYLPEQKAREDDEFYDPKTKPPKSYNKILAEMKAVFNSEKDD